MSAGLARNERVDFLRGTCILGMACWHLLTHPSYPRWLSFPIIQGFNFVAEGFVLLAGVSAGLILARGGSLASQSRRSLERAAKLLLIHYGVVSLLVLGARLGAWDCGNGAVGSSWAAIAPRILSLRYQPYLADVLTVFVFLFAITPPLLVGYRRLGEKGLVAASALLYCAVILPWPWVRSGWLPALEPNRHGAFDLYSWQFVYVLGMVVGGRLEGVERQIRGRFAFYAPAAVLAFGMIAAFRWVVTRDPALARGLPRGLLFDRHPVGLGHLAYSLSELFAIAVLATRCWEVAARTWGARLLVLFGRRSLAVFVLSIFLDYGLKHHLGGHPSCLLAGVSLLFFEMTLLALCACFRTSSGPLSRPRAGSGVIAGAPAAAGMVAGTQDASG